MQKRKNYVKAKVDLDKELGRLRTAAFKVRGISMLLQDFHSEAPPLDDDECWHGVGLILESCAGSIRRAVRRIEEGEIAKSRPTLKQEGHKNYSSISADKSDFQDDSSVSTETSGKPRR